MPRCWHCKDESTRAHYLRVVENKHALHGPWEGWRMSGRFLIAPNGNRITPERLAGIQWEERTRVSKNMRASRPGAAVIPARERFDGRA